MDTIDLIITEPIMIECVKDFGVSLPDGYIFKDENGNIINATKIVLEKKKEDVNLTQEQINTITHDSCVLFCKHCGCGIPRETCISLGTCKEYDEYRAAMRTHLMKKKKKEYPKTYEECCKVLGVNPNNYLSIRNPCCNDGDEDCTNYELGLLGIFDSLWVLRFCRDAYWKIAGEEMRLGKPWKPDLHDGKVKYMILNSAYGIEKNGYVHTNRILTFPTEEMRDAFYENFKELIEQCKELL